MTKNFQNLYKFLDSIKDNLKLEYIWAPRGARGRNQVYQFSQDQRVVCYLYVLTTVNANWGPQEHIIEELKQETVPCFLIFLSLQSSKGKNYMFTVSDVYANWPRRSTGGLKYVLPKGCEHKEYSIEKLKSFLSDVLKQDDFSEKEIRGILKDKTETERIARETSKTDRYKFGKGGEGTEHRELKEYIAKHPEFLGIHASDIKETHIDDYPFPSGDKPDIVFKLAKKTSSVVVEIKTDGHEKVLAGFFQAIKYKALEEAKIFIDAGQRGDVVAFLVAYKIPVTVKEYANQFGIKTLEIPKEEVRS